VAAHSIGANFLGIEINPEFVDFANKWLQKAGSGTLKECA